MKKNRLALVIVYDWYLHHGGASRIAKSIVNMLLAEGWEVHVMTHDQVINGDNSEDKMKIISYRSHGSENYKLPISAYLSDACNVLNILSALMKRYQYRLIHAHHYVAGLAFQRLKEIGNIKKIFTCHGIRRNHFECYNFYDYCNIDSVKEGWKAGAEAAMLEAMHVLEELCITNADIVTCVSQSVSEDVNRYWPSIKPNIVGNYYCLNEYDNGSLKLPLALSEGPKKNIILFAGRWEKTKGADIIASVGKKLPNNKYQIVHAGLLNGVDKVPEITYFGHLRDGDLITLYKSADLVLMPSRYEPFGLTAIESMMHNTPVLGHYVGGLKEIIHNNVNGWILRKLDIEIWSDSIVRLFEKQKIDSLRASGFRKKIISTYDSKKSLHKYRELIEKSL